MGFFKVCHALAQIMTERGRADVAQKLLEQQGRGSVVKHVRDTGAAQIVRCQ